MVSHNKIKKDIEAKITKLVELTDKYLPVMKKTRTKNLLKVLPNKTMVKLLLQNTEQLAELHDFYDNWNFSQKSSD